MNNLQDMLWIETRKAVQSKMPLWTALGSLFMPIGIAFLIFVSRNPEISERLGLVGAKANLLAYSGTDWAAYMGFISQMVAAVGFFLGVIITGWVFGREFADGTVKDMMAVPVDRGSIVLAKFVVASLWSAWLFVLQLLVSLAAGALMGLPGGSTAIISKGAGLMMTTGLLTVVVITPFGLLASIGRGYLLPVGVAALTLMMANLVAVVGWGGYFPWAIPGLYAHESGIVPRHSVLMVAATGLAGVIFTHAWWKYADQNR